jgi:hypothetical protein
VEITGQPAESRVTKARHDDCIAVYVGAEKPVRNADFDVAEGLGQDARQDPRCGDVAVGDQQGCNQ